MLTFEAMARICVDMDEVMADTVLEHLRRYNEEYGESLSKADLNGKWLWQAVPSHRHEQLAAYLDDPQFFAELPLMHGAQDVLERLSRDHEVYVASAAMEVPRSFNAKFAWLQRHFPFLPPSQYVFCGTKSILHADYLIDDNPRQLRAFSGKGILFSTPHNLSLDAESHGWHRADNWQAVDRFFS